MALAIQGARLDGGQLCSPNMTSWPRRARGRAPGYARGAGLVALTLALLAGCGGTGGAAPAESPEPGPAPAPAAKEPFNIEEALARETGELPARELRAADWSARAFGAGEAKIEPKEKLVAISIPLGTDTHVECFVYNTMLDSGEVIRNFIELLDPAKVEVARVVPWEVSVHRESPAVFVQALYLVPTAGGKAAGLLKIALHADRARPIACLHDEVGYVRTFERLAKGLFDSFESKSAAPKPEYTDTVILRLDKVPVGFETSDLLKDEGGQRRWFSRSATFLPRDPKSLHIEDEASNVLIDPQGQIKEGVWIETSGGKANHRIELSQKKNFEYEYSGEVEGKKVQGTFTPAAKAWLASPVATASALARLLKKKGSFDLKQQEYMPSVDPTKPVDVQYLRDASGAVTVSLKTMRLVGSLAPDGRPEAFEISAGPPKLTIQRAYVRGKL
ncbi:hypothetical protein WME97_21665 [Sorangium sp. So ce367]|uniref:hypothetical protein n=1 Tax=Sorangium sp. So ce367 TaxID=3133305 RepID=UPI003F5EC05E